MESGRADSSPKRRIRKATGHSLRFGPGSEVLEIAHRLFARRQHHKEPAFAQTVETDELRLLLHAVPPAGGFKGARGG